MLFNSNIFIFIFLPFTLVLFYVVGSKSQTAAKYILSVMSLVFYTWWRPIHLPILIFSILFNYFVGEWIQKAQFSRDQSKTGWLLAFGVSVDVLLLFVFKYLNFVAKTADAVGANFVVPHIILPLAISFFTFQKIAYLADSARGRVKHMSLSEFVLFASFFPQLIAGPIVHYSEVVPQFSRRLFGKIRWRDILIGLVIFGVGLLKKSVIADTIATQVDPLYAAVSGGGALSLSRSWQAALTYTFQLYFDFSGYSDMAIGLARMLGVRLPLNFHSPLRATSIMEYWRRWHMTLQRFIVAYIFEPLSVPLMRWSIEKDLPRWLGFALGVMVPSFITFLIVGIWHGAGWTFVVFGTLHGIYVAGNQFWREQQSRRRKGRTAAQLRTNTGTLSMIATFASWLFTMICVLFANVVFRAATVGAATSIWRSMFGLVLARSGLGDGDRAVHVGTLLLWVGCAATILLMPNTQQIMRRFTPAFNWREWVPVGRTPIPWTWRPDLIGLAFGALALVLGVVFVDRGPAVFIYFNF